MPAYDYKCPTCDCIFEVVRRAGDSAAVTCPTCSVEAKRIFSPVGVVFKGTGFHNTDYRTTPRDPGSGESPSTTEPKTTPATPCTKKPGDGGCSGCPAAT